MFYNRILYKVQWYMKKIREIRESFTMEVVFWAEPWGKVRWTRKEEHFRYIHGLLSPKPGLLDLDSISPSPSVEGHEEKHASPPFQTTGEHRGLSIQHPPGNQLLELTTWATRNQLNSPCQNLFTVLPSPSLSSGTLWFLSWLNPH